MASSSSSILEAIGDEIIGVMSPVSICMLAVVVLVYSAATNPSPETPITTAANLVYSENPSDSIAEKLEGSLLNAAVFVVLVAAVTFVIFVLYYYRFTNCLTNYTRFSSFLILSSLGAPIFVSLLRRFSLPLDPITAMVFLFNFAAVGSFSLFSAGFPIVLRQFYMLAIAVIVAAWFSRLPEWTTWSLLLSLSVYDLAAVLAPGGPLKLLVELASSRGDDIPALIYEARPSPSRHSRSQSPPIQTLELQPLGAATTIRDSPAPQAVNSNENDDELSMQASPIQTPELQPLVHNPVTITDSPAQQAVNYEENSDERSPLVNVSSSSSSRSPMVNGSSSHPEEMEEREGGIKLGLGDFIFYSVLVGRAAKYDLMTVYACYVAIVSGLAATLLLLSVYRKALPALPISIAFGTLFYFSTRLLMEPFLVAAATNLLMF